MQSIEEFVGERLKALRKEKNYTQTYVGKKLGCSQTFISKCEKADIKIPFDILLKYAKFFGVSLDYIFGRVKNRDGEIEMPYREMSVTQKQINLTVNKLFDRKNDVHYKFKNYIVKLVEEELKKIDTQK